MHAVVTALQASSLKLCILKNAHIKGKRDTASYVTETAQTLLTVI